MGYGVIGNTSVFDAEECGFETRYPNEGKFSVDTRKRGTVTIGVWYNGNTGAFEAFQIVGSNPSTLTMFNIIECSLSLNTPK